jgi:two-component system cell cycle sensor histidine kinase/response regulator CckA
VLAFAGRAMPGFIGNGWTSVVHPEDLDGVQNTYAAAVDAVRSFRIECRMRRANGRYRWVLHTGIPHFIDGVFSGHIGTSIDITDLKRSHEHMLVTAKLESLGALSAGIAHDFNNLVGSIFAASDLALSDLPPDSPARESIERINSVATRASEIVNLLMAYADGHSVRVDRIDLSLIAAEMVELLTGTISPKAVLEASLAPDLPEVRANVTQIRQVILNLIMNASESLERQEGIIKVITDRVCMSGVGSRSPGRPSTDVEYCRLVVSDTGCGMMPDVSARAFDPFYTTKSIGRGLGLAVVQGIVRTLGGAINITTRPGVGSTFEVLVPCDGRGSHESLPRHQTAAGCEE